MRLARFVCTVAVIGNLIAPAAATAHGKSRATLAGSSRFDPNQGAYVGPGVLTIDGKAYNVLGASTLLGALSVDQKGVINAAVSHHFTSLDPNVSIDFYTFDEVVLTPTQTPGLYDVVNHMEIVLGHGLVRGGRFDSEPGDVRSAGRSTQAQSGCGSGIGFRVTGAL